MYRVSIILTIRLIEITVCYLFLVKFVCIKIFHMFIDISCFFLIKEKTQDYLWRPSSLNGVNTYERKAVLDHLPRAFIVEYSLVSSR